MTSAMTTASKRWRSNGSGMASANPGSGWFVYLRLYGPDGPAFDGRWKPGDFEEMAPPSIGRALQ
jgi:hypothetical protein